MFTLIKGLKEIVSLYEYCESNGLIYPEDAGQFCNLDNVGIVQEDEREIDQASLNDIFVTLWLRKFTDQIKTFDNVKWDASTEGAFIKLSSGGYILVKYLLDDKICFGSHDTIYVEYMDKEQLNQDLLNKITEIIKAEPKVQRHGIVAFEVEAERDPSFWSTNYSEVSKPAKVIGMLSEMVKTISK